MLSAIGHVAPLAGPDKLFGWAALGAAVAYYTWAHVEAHRLHSVRTGQDMRTVVAQLLEQHLPE